jgi:hypothetical protein
LGILHNVADIFNHRERVPQEIRGGKKIIGKTKVDIRKTQFHRAVFHAEFFLCRGGWRFYGVFFLRVRRKIISFEILRPKEGAKEKEGQEP